jgi:DNA polymerase V
MDNDLAPMADSNALSIHNGFPNPALDKNPQSYRLSLDLNQVLIRHPSGTYLFRIKGHNWADEGIYDGDLAIIDRFVAPRRSDLVISWQHDTFTICRRNRLEADDTPWGTVSAVIHQYT